MEVNSKVDVLVAAARVHVISVVRHRVYVLPVDTQRLHTQQCTLAPDAHRSIVRSGQAATVEDD